MDSKKYKLKDGIILRPYGQFSLVDNSNLTDLMAELFIKKGKAKKEDFIIKQTTQKTKKQNGNSSNK